MATSAEERRAMGVRARQMVHDRYSRDVLCTRFVDIVEAAIAVPA
jgi:hypothetical protein